MNWDKKLLLMAIVFVCVGVASSYILRDITGMVLLLFFAFMTMVMRHEYIAELKEFDEYVDGLVTATDEDNI